MDVVIFAGGFGTRLAEETHSIPKPMVEIGGMPMLIHIMKYYSEFNLNSFIICGGYKVEYIKNYFRSFMENMNDFELDFKTGEVKFFNEASLDWRVKILDTGLHTQTAGRLKRVRDYIQGDNFCLTYGDGLSNINISEVITEHRRSNAHATLSAVVPPARFGALKFDGTQVVDFTEKPLNQASRINGGFMVVNKKVIDLISSDDQSFEEDILPSVARKGLLNSYFHDGFWRPMDTLRDKNQLEELWSNGEAPWKV